MELKWQMVQNQESGNFTCKNIVNLMDMPICMLLLGANGILFSPTTNKIILCFGYFQRKTSLIALGSICGMNYE